MADCVIAELKHDRSLFHERLAKATILDTSHKALMALPLQISPCFLPQCLRNFTDRDMLMPLVGGMANPKKNRGRRLYSVIAPSGVTCRDDRCVEQIANVHDLSPVVPTLHHTDPVRPPLWTNHVLIASQQLRCLNKGR